MDDKNVRKIAFALFMPKISSSIQVWRHIYPSPGNLNQQSLINQATSKHVIKKLQVTLNKRLGLVFNHTGYKQNKTTVDLHKLTEILSAQQLVAYFILLQTRKIYHLKRPPSYYRRIFSRNHIKSTRNTNSSTLNRYISHGTFFDLAENLWFMPPKSTTHLNSRHTFQKQATEWLRNISPSGLNDLALKTQLVVCTTKPLSCLVKHAKRANLDGASCPGFDLVLLYW